MPTVVYPDCLEGGSAWLGLGGHLVGSHDALDGSLQVLNNAEEAA